MKRRYIAPFLLLGPLLALSLDAHAETAQRQVVFRENLFWLGAYGSGIASALQGEGKKAASRKQTNVFDKNQQDEIYTEQLPGIETTRLIPGPYPERRLLLSLSVGKSDRPLSEDLGIEVYSEQRVMDSYGLPAKRERDSLTYYVPHHAGRTTINFHFQSGVLTRVEWRWGE